MRKCKQRLAAIVLLLFCCNAAILAQQRINVPGKVLAENGDELSSTTITVLNVQTRNKNVLVSDSSGSFELKGVLAGQKYNLYFEHIGYAKDSLVSLIFSSNEANTLLMRMKLAAGNSLSEVVVTALGIKRQAKALSYEVQQVNQSALTTVQNSNLVNSLNGRVAGIQINSSSAGIGGASRVVLRGTKSIGGTNGAFYVIDGIPLVDVNQGKSEGVYGGTVGSQGIADFNPEDIESISVLTGPSAAALYGSQAAQGVILINTKKGERNGVRLNYSNSTTFYNPIVMPKFQNTYGSSDAYQSWGDKMGIPSTYDPKDFFNTGLQEINSLSASIGSGKSQTVISGAALNAKGIVPNNKYNRYNFTFRNTNSFLNDKVTTDVGASYVNQADQNMVSQGQYFNPILATYLFPRGDDFDAMKYYERYDASRLIPVQYWPYGTQGLSLQNPYWTTNRLLFPNIKNRYMFTGAISYKPLSWFTIAARGRIDNTYQESEKKFYASTDAVFGASEKGYYSYANNKLSNLYSDVIATINKKFDDFTVNVSVGSSYQKVQPTIKGYQGPLATIPNLFALQNINVAASSAIEGTSNSINSAYPYDAWANSAVFGVAEVGYKNYLFLTVSGRNDWNSHLVNTSKNNFFYPSLGLSAVVSDMVKLPSAISYLKVRGSYAQVGSPISIFGLTPGTVTYPISAGQVGKVGYPATSTFQPEKTNSYEAGFNLKMFRNKVGLDVTVYKSNTYNQLILTAASGTSGYDYNMIQAGNVMNKGIEAALTYDNRGAVIKYSTGLTLSLNRNKVVEIADNPVGEDGKIGTPITNYVVPGTNNMGKVYKGESMGEIYATQLLQRDGNGNILISGDGTFVRVNQNTRLGNTNPDYTLGWRNDIGYKNFSLGLMFFARVGGIVTSQTQAMLDAYGVSQASADARNNGGVLVNGVPYDTKSFYSQVGGLDPLLAFYTYDATNIRLQEASLSYTLPKHLFNDKLKLTVSLLGNNLLMIYNKAPYDPQQTPSTGTYYQGYDYFMLPSLRSFGFGIKAQF
ncbi:SusC/RagA family TonB-linked outer membrane protein [Pinibacter soli]|uniref:SusC/RagA family TonB-linked outer membrane protein n=1 Tax=Pinibacter soli TaxID=3044211 RepID=A0ABT6RH80_9BACT|nr:SusC/RagA family TonB-linked outer membrane protein [Pinibacter soli]MDI3321910.1 SusC/RagA family TonB-linked outer membrane protein [Pinibacter soli]